MAVKKSIYLEPDLDEALKAAAKAEGRSVTKQIDISLRLGLGLMDHKPQFWISGSTADLVREAKPDPKIKASPKKLR